MQNCRFIAFDVSQYAQILKHTPEPLEPEQPQKLHLTLAFFPHLGSQYEFQINKILTEYAEQEEIVLTHMEPLGNSLVLSGKNAKLTQMRNDLLQRIEEHCPDIYYDCKPFKPHVTLARNVSNYPNIVVPEKEIEPIRLQLNSLSFMERTEDGYACITRIDLQ